MEEKNRIEVFVRHKGRKKPRLKDLLLVERKLKWEGRRDDAEKYVKNVV